VLALNDAAGEDVSSMAEAAKEGGVTSATSYAPAVAQYQPDAWGRLSFSQESVMEFAAM
jgi:hypothetical protein